LRKLFIILTIITLTATASPRGEQLKQKGQRLIAIGVPLTILTGSLCAPLIIAGAIMRKIGNNMIGGKK
jgi:hypothetical protein